MLLILHWHQSIIKFKFYHISKSEFCTWQTVLLSCVWGICSVNTATLPRYCLVGHTISQPSVTLLTALPLTYAHHYLSCQLKDWPPISYYHISCWVEGEPLICTYYYISCWLDGKLPASTPPYFIGQTISHLFTCYCKINHHQGITFSLLATITLLLIIYCF